MKDHTKNILITLLFALVIGLILFGVGFAVGTEKVASLVIDKGFEYLKDQNITILGLNPNNAYDMHKVYSIVKGFILK